MEPNQTPEPAVQLTWLECTLLLPSAERIGLLSTGYSVRRVVLPTRRRVSVEEFEDDMEPPK